MIFQNFQEYIFLGPSSFFVYRKIRFCSDGPALMSDLNFLSSSFQYISVLCVLIFGFVYAFCEHLLSDWASLALGLGYFTL